jgi:hypothetical protein
MLREQAVPFRFASVSSVISTQSDERNFIAEEGVIDLKLPGFICSGVRAKLSL